LVSVSVDDVRDVISVGSAEVPDAKVLKMVKRAEVALDLEKDKEIDYSNCTDAEKEFITVLAAIYAICYLTGGSAVGLGFSVGSQNVSVLSNAPPLDVLQNELRRILAGIKGVYLGSTDQLREYTYGTYYANSSQSADSHLEKLAKLVGICGMLLQGAKSISFGDNARFFLLRKNNVEASVIALPNATPIVTMTIQRGSIPFSTIAICLPSDISAATEYYLTVSLEIED